MGENPVLRKSCNAGPRDGDNRWPQLRARAPLTSDPYGVVMRGLRGAEAAAIRVVEVIINSHTIRPATSRLYGSEWRRNCDSLCTQYGSTSAKLLPAATHGGARNESVERES